MDAFESFHPVPAAWLRDSDLAPFISAYICRLVDRHYAANTVRMYVYGVAHFAHWARVHRVDLRHLGDEVVRRFIDEHLPHCTCPSPVQRSRHQVRAALRQLLVTLLDAGGLISSDQPDAIEHQLQRFDSHMVHARGLAETTRIRRLGVVRALLRFRAADHPDVMATPSADELRRFITQELSRISPASASSLAGALRAYLRFLTLGGVGVDHLLPVIASPTALHTERAGHVVQALRDVLANALHGLAAAAGRVLWLQANLGARQVRGQGLALGGGLGAGGGACGRAQLLQALLCGGDVLFVGLGKQLGLGRVHGLGPGGKAQVAQHADLVREGVDPGLAQEQLSIALG